MRVETFRSQGSVERFREGVVGRFSAREKLMHTLLRYADTSIAGLANFRTVLPEKYLGPLRALTGSVQQHHRILAIKFCPASIA